MGAFGLGLGKALGAAGLGAVTGQGRGEAEGYRRDQAQQNAAYRQAVLAAQTTKATGKADPDAHVKQVAGQLLTEIVKGDLNPELQQYIHDHPEFGAHRQQIVTHLQRVVSGQIPGSQFDLNGVGQLGSVYDRLHGLDHPLTTGTYPESGAATTPPEETSATGPTTQPSPFDRVPNAAPPTLPLTPKTANLGQIRGSVFGPQEFNNLVPSTALPAVLSGEPEGGLPKPETPPEPQTAAAQTAAPKAPYDPRTALNTLLDQGAPHLEKQPYETDKAHNARQKAAQTEWSDQVNRLTAALVAMPRAAVLGFNASHQGQKFASEQAGRTAGTALKKEQLRASQQITPVKVQQGQSTITHQRVTERLGQGHLTETQRHNQAAEATAARQAATAEGRAKTSASEAQARIKQINNTLSTASRKELNATDRATLTAGLRVLTAQTRTASGATKPAFSPADRTIWQQRIDDVMSRMSQKQAKPVLGQGVATGASAKPTTAAPATAPAAPLTEGHLGVLKQWLSGGQFAAKLAEARQQQPALVPQILRGYRQLKGRDWAGR